MFSDEFTGETRPGGEVAVVNGLAPGVDDGGETRLVQEEDKVAERAHVVRARGELGDRISCGSARCGNESSAGKWGRVCINTWNGRRWRMLRWEVDEVETVAVISGAVEKSASILVELDGLSGQDCLEAGVAELTEGEEGMSEVREDVALTSCQGKIKERKESSVGGLHLVAVG